MVHLESLSKWAVGVVLIFGSLTKLWSFDWFAQVVQRYYLTPRRAQHVVAIVIIMAELVVGGLLISGRCLPWSAYFACVLFGVFAVAISINLLRGRSDIPCGCNGLRKKTTVSWYLISRNVGLIGFALLAVPDGILNSHHVYLYGFMFSVVLFGLSFAPQPACAREI